MTSLFRIIPNVGDAEYYQQMNLDFLVIFKTIRQKRQEFDRKWISVSVLKCVMSFRAKKFSLDVVQL